MSGQPWTIESICKALGHPAIRQRFLAEINKAPAHQLLPVFAKWEVIAKDIVAAVEQGHELAAAEARGEDLPGQWIDVTDRIRAEADQIRARGAA
jgi:hypothetical protein